MRRSLVLTREGARHSFRASLPASVTLRGRQGAQASDAEPTFSFSLSDMRGFANAYIAALAAALVFFM